MFSIVATSVRVIPQSVFIQNFTVKTSMWKYYQGNES